jgi:hypothetical protein
MNCIRWLIAAALSTGTALATAEETIIDQPMTATSLRFADRYASVFYTVDSERYNLVVAIAAGAQDNAQLIRQTIQLKDGQSYRLSIGGYGNNEQATTIRMTRRDKRIVANVITCPSKADMANCI